MTGVANAPAALVRFAIDEDAYALDWVSDDRDRLDALDRLAHAWESCGAFVQPSRSPAAILRDRNVSAALRERWEVLLRSGLPMVPRHEVDAVDVTLHRHPRGVHASGWEISRADLAPAFRAALRQCGRCLPRRAAREAVFGAFVDGPLALAHTLVVVDRYLLTSPRGVAVACRLLERAARIGPRKHVYFVGRGFRAERDESREAGDERRAALRDAAVRQRALDGSRLALVEVYVLQRDSLFHDRWVHYYRNGTPLCAFSFGTGLDNFGESESTRLTTVTRLHLDRVLLDAEAYMRSHARIDDLSR